MPWSSLATLTTSGSIGVKAFRACGPIPVHVASFMVFLVGLLSRSIHNKEGRPVGRGRAVRLGLVRHLVAHAGPQHMAAAVFQFGVQFAFEAQENMALAAPVVGHITGAVFDHAYPDVAELPGAPEGLARDAGMLGARHRGPVGRAERNVVDLHPVWPFL